MAGEAWRLRLSGWGPECVDRVGEGFQPILNSRPKGFLPQGMLKGSSLRA